MALPGQMKGADSYKGKETIAVSCQMQLKVAKTFASDVA